jgi:hypothetical protein
MASVSLSKSYSGDAADAIQAATDVYNEHTAQTFVPPTDNPKAVYVPLTAGEYLGWVVDRAVESYQSQHLSPTVSRKLYEEVVAAKERLEEQVASVNVAVDAATPA